MLKPSHKTMITIQVYANGDKLAKIGIKVYLNSTMQNNDFVGQLIFSHNFHCLNMYRLKKTESTA
jgi:hypothetical protein